MAEKKSIKQALNLAFLKQKLERKEIELFKKEFIALRDRINPKETEEFHKNLIKDFLNAVYYKDKHYINTKGKNDLVIHNGNNTTFTVGVLIEVKSPINKTEMVSHENLNVKSFQELILYYLRERKTGKNLELCYLIITNIYEWFVFDAQDFEKLFYQNKILLNLFEQFQVGKLSGTSTDFFYKEIASIEIQKIQPQIPYTHFDIRNYDDILCNTDKEDDKKLIVLYKFLSPVHLLKLPFVNDNNQLNKEFYAELLHIIGLEEIKQNNRKLIVRKKETERDSGSIIENAIERIDVKNKLDNLDVEQLGKTKEEQLFNVALGLAITWINRILFLKLLESQILKYHNGNKDYAFLSSDKLIDYDDLDCLFFSVLARKEEDRKESIKAKFAHVPYLNSSLFEITEVEDKTICIDSLQDNIQITLYSKSVLHDGNNNPATMKPLEYLLRFLDAYDFSSEGSEDIQEENKPLISASVLGLIFEKINGYKDGSFFTPSFITMYMCRETISRAVIQKFNEVKEWNCQTINDLYNKIEDFPEANAIFNSVRICDPAVGSGHFLVSSLNEMIYLKSELGILMDKNGRRLKDYRVTVENDELIITDNEGNYFTYNPLNIESQRVQEVFFYEKQTIIENCLFGVDINPNSVKICQLRLWIELLKHTYYRSGTNKLETLPNIDINIKCGNSLISRFDLHGNYSALPVATQQKLQRATREYKDQVILYKCMNDKATRKQTCENIARLKTTFCQINNPTDKDYQKWKEAENRINMHIESIRFDGDKDVWNKQLEQLQVEINSLREKYESKMKTLYANAFEWNFEFPEVLDDNGNFVGFDIVIGNPPYISVKQIFLQNKNYYSNNYKTAMGQFDLYGLFIEKGISLLKENGIFSMITSNTFLNNKDFRILRKFLLQNTEIKNIVNLDETIFEVAKVDVAIIVIKNNTGIDNQIFVQKNKSDFLSKKYNIIKQSIYNQDHLHYEFKLNCSDKDFVLIQKMYNNKVMLKTILGLPRGIEMGANNDLIKSKDDGNLHKLLVGKDIGKYCISFRNRFIAFDEKNKSKFKDMLIYKSQKILIQRIRNLSLSQRIVAAYDDDSYLCTNTLRIGISKNKQFSLKFLLALLNSKVVNFLFRKYFLNKDIYVYQLEQIPIPNVALFQQQPIISLVEQILSAKKENLLADTSVLEQEIDRLVYELYGLTKEEIRIIENK